MMSEIHDGDKPVASNVTALPFKPPVSRGRKLVLVDFENVPNVTLSGLDAETEVIVFIGVQQKSAPIELAMTAQQLGKV